MPAPLKPTCSARLPPNYRPPPARASAIASAVNAERRNPRHRSRTSTSATKAACSLAPWAPPCTRSLRTLPACAKPTTGTQPAPPSQQLQPRIAAQIRATGIDPAQAAAIAAKRSASPSPPPHDPTGQWILSPHPDDASEARWTGIIAGSLRTVQVDRIFRAGLEPLSEGNEAWWIIDYKTAHADIPTQPQPCPNSAQLFAPQLEAYAAGPPQPARRRRNPPRRPLLSAHDRSSIGGRSESQRTARAAVHSPFPPENRNRIPLKRKLAQEIQARVKPTPFLKTYCRFVIKLPAPSSEAASATPATFPAARPPGSTGQRTSASSYRYRTRRSEPLPSPAPPSAYAPHSPCPSDRSPRATCATADSIRRASARRTPRPES